MFSQLCRLRFNWRREAFFEETFSFLRCRALFPKMQILQKDATSVPAQVHFKAHSCDTSHCFRRRTQYVLGKRVAFLFKKTCASTSKVPNMSVPKTGRLSFHCAFGQKYCMSSSRIFQKTENRTKQTQTRYAEKMKCLRSFWFLLSFIKSLYDYM